MACSGGAAPRLRSRFDAGRRFATAVQKLRGFIVEVLRLVFDTAALRKIFHFIFPGHIR